jgi:glycosyltransferase
MKVSVITVSYNSALTIGDTLRSVAAQRHPDIEHIVVDGASKDGTREVIREHGAHVARFISEPDHGIYDAMNKGIAAATGDLIGFLNADDAFANRDTVARLAAVVVADDSDAVYGDLLYVRADQTDKVVRLWRSGEYRRSRLRFGWMPPHPTFYVRNHVMREAGGFDIRLRIAADYDFMLRCLAAADRCVTYVPEVLVRMRLGGARNRDVGAMWRKSREDLDALRRSGIGGVGTLLCKNLRKLPQFVTSIGGRSHPF